MSHMRKIKNSVKPLMRLMMLFQRLHLKYLDMIVLQEKSQACQGGI